MRSGCPLGGNKSSRETKPRRGLYVARFARKWRQPSHLRFIKLLSHFSSPPTNDIRHISSFHVKFINRNLIVHHQRDPSKYTEQMKLFVYKEDIFSIPSLPPPPSTWLERNVRKRGDWNKLSRGRGSLFRRRCGFRSTGPSSVSYGQAWMQTLIIIVR